MADTHVTITGNLTDDPELKHTPNGNLVANFRLAEEERFILAEERTFLRRVT